MPRRKASSRSIPGFDDVPFELLTEIALYLIRTPAAFNSFMRTCWHVTYVCERVRYHSMALCGLRGRQLLATLLSVSPPVLRYQALVSRLWYHGWHDKEMLLGSVLLSEVLPRLRNLKTLWIDAFAVDTPHLVNRLRYTGVAIGTRSSTSSPGATGYPALPMPDLVNFKMTGDVSLASLAFHRPIQELELDSSLDAADLAFIRAEAKGSPLADSLKTLSIRLRTTSDPAAYIPVLGDTFPLLERLAIRQNGLALPSLLEAYTATDNSCLPHLQIFVLNHVYVSITTITQKPVCTDPALECVRRALAVMHDRKPGVLMVGGGRRVWSREGWTSFRMTMLSRNSAWWTRYFGNQTMWERFNGDVGYYALSVSRRGV